MNRDWHAHSRYGAGLLILLAIYFSTARLGLMLDAVSGFATLVWPPTGLALAALLLYGNRLWPGIALGACLVNWSIGASLFTACGTALGNTLEALVGAYVLRRVVRFDQRLERLRDVVGLVGLAAPLGAMISATIGVSSLWLGGKVTTALSVATWRAWWIGDVLGAIIFTPLVLVWSTPPTVRRPAGPLELWLLGMTLVVAGDLAFGGALGGHPIARISLAYLIFPPLIWAALRCRQRGAITATFGMSMLAVWYTVQGTGPFARETMSEGLLSLQTFMAVVAVTILIMAVMVAERASAEHAARASREALEEAREALEQTVQKRTATLTAAFGVLKRTATELSFVNNLAEQTVQPLAVTDFEGRILRFNRAFQQLTGYTAQELRAMRYQDLTPERWHQMEQQQIDRLMTTQRAVRYQKEYRRKDGVLVPLELVVDLYRNGDGHPECLYAFLTDITERKRTQEELQRTNQLLVTHQQELIDALVKLEQAHQELQATQLQLIQSAKLESVGRLAAGVAHEVKNPLATLLIGIDHLSDHFIPSDQNVSLLLRDMNRAVRRADSVIRGLLDFSSTKTLETHPEDLNGIIEEALTLVKHEVDRAHVMVVRNLAANLPLITVDRCKLQQVFVNLFMNAIQAMPEGGELTLTTTLRTLDAPSDDIGARRTDRFRLGESVVVADIEDTGPGIPEDTFPKIFDPFFTTKPPGAGTGLGLTVTKKIIELHDGILVVKNRPCGGVRATVMLHVERGCQRHHGQKASAAH